MRRLLIVRTDAIGDAILWNGALPGLRCAFPLARIAIACREAVVPIYETAPEIDEIIPIDIGAIARDPTQTHAPAARLSDWGADVLLHPTRSREKHTEGLIARVHAARKVALRSDLANATADERDRFDAGYDELIATPDHEACELDRHADVLRHFGVEASVRPRVILTQHDHAAASEVLADSAIEGSRLLLLAPAARWPIRLYPHWAEATSFALEVMTGIDAVATVGGSECRDAAEACLMGIRSTGIRVANLCGRTDLRTTIALIDAARLCAGNETFTAHAAAAVATPSATLLGGGHLGRFMPYSRDSVCAVRPLACSGCNWRCAYTRPHCIGDVPPSVMAETMALALTPNQSAKPRIVLDVSTKAANGHPLTAPLPVWLAPRVEMIATQPTTRVTITR